VQDLEDTILDLIITGSRRGLNAKRPHLLPQAQRRPAMDRSFGYWRRRCSRRREARARLGTGRGNQGELEGGAHRRGRRRGGRQSLSQRRRRVPVTRAAAASGLCAGRRRGWQGSRGRTRGG
jgi:hypothetical protein